MKNSLWVIAVLALLVSACNPYSDTENRRHFMFRGHPYLVVQDTLGNRIDAYDYMTVKYEDGTIRAELLRPDGILIDRNIDKPYDGKLVSVSRHGATMQSVIRNGSLHSYKIWYSNHRLSMQYDVPSEVGRNYKSNGQLAIAWLGESVIRYHSSTGMVARVETEDQVEIYDLDGTLKYYRVKTDTSSRDYYNNNAIKSEYIYREDGYTDVKHFYKNGQIQTTGTLLNREWIGTWVMYDSLGNVVNSENYSEES